MIYSFLGQSGIQVSRLSIGTWLTLGDRVKDKPKIFSIFDEALDKGVNHFDFADVYGGGESERVFGEYLKGKKRSRFVVSSKAFKPLTDDVNDRGLSRKHLYEALEGSLERLNLDYLDIYYCHRFDPNTSVKEVAHTFNHFIQQGRIMSWGTSEWPVEQLMALQEYCADFGLIGPCVEQSRVNLLNQSRKEKLESYLSTSGASLIAWGPLASGFLTGKHQKGVRQQSRLEQVKWIQDEVYTKENLKRMESLVAIAEREEVPVTVLALAWILAQPHLASLVLGVTRIEQLKENLDVLSYAVPQEIIDEISEAFPSSLKGDVDV